MGIGILFAGALSVVVVVQIDDQVTGSLLRIRDFYGALVVSDIPATRQHPASRKLSNGSIDHGEQLLTPGLRGIPTTWYGSQSGIGYLLRGVVSPRPRRVGVIGLGAGTLAAYGRRGDHYRFYEINPSGRQRGPLPV